MCPHCGVGPRAGARMCSRVACRVATSDSARPRARRSDALQRQAGACTRERPQNGIARLPTHARWRSPSATIGVRLATPNENEAARARLACQSKPLLPRVRAKASRGFEPRSLDSESRVLTVTPRGRLHTHRARPLWPKQGPAMQKLAAPHASARDGNAPPQPRRSRAKSSTTTRMMAQTLDPAYRFPTEDDEEGQPG